MAKRPRAGSFLLTTRKNPEEIVLTTAVRRRNVARKGETAYKALKKDVPKTFFHEQNGRFAAMLLSRLFAFSTLVATFIAVDVTIENSWVKILLSIMIAYPTGLFQTQIALCAHDVGHKSAFRESKTNTILGIFLGNFLLGVSPSWWNEKHNQHHKTPNRLEADTDIDFPILAFDIRQVAEKRKIFHPILRNQHLLIFPLMSLQALNTQIGTIRYLLTVRSKNRAYQIAANALHWGAIALLVYFTGWAGLIFVTVAMLVHGICNGSVFAPNHKGMEIVDADAPEDRFRDQVATARNVHGNNWLTRRLVSFWYGGLDLQIEHHLFPTMPRGNLRKITETVKAHCTTNNLRYISVTPMRSYWEVYLSLREVAHAIRRGEHRQLELARAQ